MAKLIVAAILAVMLTGCGNPYDRQLKQIEWFFGWGETGSSRDYMLVKYGIAGRDPVAVIFGFLDDATFCREVAELYMSRYPADQYYCEPVN